MRAMSAGPCKVMLQRGRGACLAEVAHLLQVLRVQVIRPVRHHHLGPLPRERVDQVARQEPRGAEHRGCDPADLPRTITLRTRLCLSAAWHVQSTSKLLLAWHAGGGHTAELCEVGVKKACRGHRRCLGKGARTDERPPGPAFMPLFFTAKCVMSVDISRLLLLLHAASRAACGSKAVQCI